MSWTAERARVASLSRSRAADDPELIEARQNLKSERLAAHVERAITEAPPLSAAQVDRIVTILRGAA